MKGHVRIQNKKGSEEIRNEIGNGGTRMRKEMVF